MRLVHQRRRTWAWWGVFTFAAIVIVAYVFFDIFDVDGSQMTGWPADDMVIAEAFHLHAERFFRTDGVPPSINYNSLSLAPCRLTHPAGSPTGIGPNRGSQRKQLPVFSASTAALSSSSSTSDPV